jgi:hypothetical protein
MFELGQDPRCDGCCSRVAPFPAGSLEQFGSTIREMILDSLDAKLHRDVGGRSAERLPYNRRLAMRRDRDAPGKDAQRHTRRFTDAHKGLATAAERKEDSTGADAHVRGDRNCVRAGDAENRGCAGLPVR